MEIELHNARVGIRASEDWINEITKIRPRGKERPIPMEIAKRITLVRDLLSQADQLLSEAEHHYADYKDDIR
jgi:hypothetical protein